MLVFTSSQAAPRGGLGRAWRRLQAYLFFPLLLLEGVNLLVSSIRALAGQAVAFIAVHQGLFGVYMGCSFAPNHKGMPVLSPHQQVDYLRRQVLTSRNIRGTRIVDFIPGGLNYQIEHHLFPSMPRPSLRRSQRLIRRFCTEHSITYTQTGLIDSYRQVLRHLDEVGRPLQPLSAQ